MSIRLGLASSSADGEDPNLQTALGLARTGGRHLNLKRDILHLKLKLLVARVDGSSLELPSYCVYKIRQWYAWFSICHIDPPQAILPIER